MYFADLLRVLPKGIYISVQRDEEIFRGELNNGSVRPFRLERVSHLFPSTDYGTPILIIKLEDEE